MDSGSADGTVDLLSKYDDPRVLWGSEPDDGQSHALNKAFQLATGEYIGWLNADERYAPGAFATVASSFADYGPDVIFGDVVFEDAESGARQLHAKHQHSSFVLRYYGCYIQTSSLFMRRETLLRCCSDHRPWDESYRRVMDWELLLRLEKCGANFAHIKAPVSRFLTHANQVTADVAPRNHPEHSRIRKEYKIREPMFTNWLLRSFAKIRHAHLKVLSGGYLRERRYDEIPKSP